MEYMRLKENLKHYLALREMSAAALSRACQQHGVNVPKATISNWLAGGSVRNLDSIYIVSRVLRVSVDDLLFGDPSEREVLEASRSDKVLDVLMDDAPISGVFAITIRRVKTKV